MIKRRYFTAIALVAILAQEGSSCAGEQTEYDCVPVNEGQTDRLTCQVDTD